MVKTKNNPKEIEPNNWHRQIQIGFLTLINTYVFFTVLDGFQSNFWRVLKVQTLWTLLVTILYSLLYLFLIGSFSNLLTSLRNEPTQPQKEPLSGAYALFIGTLIVYLLIEIIMSLLIAKSMI